MQHPVSDLDPFSKEYFDDPYPAQDRLREAGDAVWLSRYGVWATARFQHVRAMLFDWKTFCSGIPASANSCRPWRRPAGRSAWAMAALRSCNWSGP